MTGNQRYIVDTNIFAYSLKKNKNGETVHKELESFVSKLNVNNFIFSRFVFSELLVGSKRREAVADLIENNLIQYDLLECTKEHMQEYVKFKTELNKQNINNKTIDWLLAAQAISEDCILVTSNIKDFEMIPNLKTKFYEVENSR